MPKPKINFVWIGDPRFNNGGQDVVGPETFDHNLKFFASKSKEERNDLVFWCQEAHQKSYQDYFAKMKVDIEVRSIETFLNNSKYPRASLVLKILKELTAPNRNQTIDRVYFKDLFFNFLLATEGNYVVDTNVQTTLDHAIHFPAYSKFMFPMVGKRGKSTVPELWMQYSPPDNLSRARGVLEIHLELYQKAAAIFEAKGYCKEYHTYVGRLATEAQLLKAPLEDKSEDYGKWECGLLERTEVSVTDFHILKEYGNTHAHGAENEYGISHMHVMFGDLPKLKFDLDHGTHPDLEANPKIPSDYEAMNETMLHIACRYGKLECAKLLLQKHADPNKEHKITYLTESGSITQTKSPLFYALESNEEKTLSVLFENAVVPVKLDRILNNETPLIKAVTIGRKHHVELLLTKGADPNQVCESKEKTQTALSVAVTLGKKELVELLLKANANPNVCIRTTTKNQESTQTPLHIALINQDADTLKLLLDHNANPFEDMFVITREQFSSTGKYSKKRIEDIKTSPACSELLAEAQKRVKPGLRP